MTPWSKATCYEVQECPTGQEVILMKGRRHTPEQIVRKL
jgi:hypothetical protein